MRLFKLKILALAGLTTSLVVFAVTAFGATAAWAEGPNWIHGAGGVTLKAGEELAMTSKNIGPFKLITRNGEGKEVNVIECEGETNEGELIGGEPGTDTASVSFTGCKGTKGPGEGCTASTSSAKPGVVGPVLVDTVLVYPKGKYKGTAEAYDAFFAKNGNLFAEFKLEGTSIECRILSRLPVKVEATGTPIATGEVKEPPAWEGKRCGLLARVGEITAGAFKVTAAGVTSAKGGLEFPSPALTEAEIETKSSGAKALTCTLESEIDGIKEKAEEDGVTELTLKSGEAFGWDV